MFCGFWGKYYPGNGSGNQSFLGNRNIFPPRFAGDTCIIEIIDAVAWNKLETELTARPPTMMPVQNHLGMLIYQNRL